MFFNLLFMKYQILLEDRTSGSKACIECPDGMLLEELSVKIKVELNLPLCDYGWHRFPGSTIVYRQDGKVILNEHKVRCTLIGRI